MDLQDLEQLANYIMEYTKNTLLSTGFFNPIGFVVRDDGRVTAVQIAPFERWQTSAMQDSFKLMAISLLPDAVLFAAASHLVMCEEEDVPLTPLEEDPRHLNALRVSGVCRAGEFTLLQSYTETDGHIVFLEEMEIRDSGNIRKRNDWLDGIFPRLSSN